MAIQIQRTKNTPLPISQAQDPRPRSGTSSDPKKATPLNRSAKMMKRQLSDARAWRFASEAGLGGATVGRSRTRRRGEKLAQRNQADKLITDAATMIESDQSGSENDLEIAVPTMPASMTIQATVQIPRRPAILRQPAASCSYSSTVTSLPPAFLVG